MPDAKRKPRAKPKYVTEGKLDAKLQEFGASLIEKVAEVIKEKPATPVYPTGSVGAALNPPIPFPAGQTTGSGVAAPAMASTTPPQDPVREREVARAVPAAQVNPEWENLARDILEDYLDHTEFVYLKTGGTLFTVVVKREKSNAPAEYLERMGSDRRSKEIGAEGTAGVDAWCRLIRANLVRPV